MLIVCFSAGKTRLLSGGDVMETAENSRSFSRFGESPNQKIAAFGGTYMDRAYRIFCA